jgi:hypothetical protein
MNTNCKYTEITDPIEIFRLHKEGKMIEFLYPSYGEWIVWPGAEWRDYWQFRLVEDEDELVPHWPALRTFEDGCSEVSKFIFCACKDAEAWYWRGTQKEIRLATEYPPIMLPRRKS